MYPKSGELSPDTASLHSSSHTQAVTGAEAEGAEASVSECVPYVDPQYATVGTQSPVHFTTMVNFPLESNDTEATTGVYHSVGAVYSPEREIGGN